MSKYLISHGWLYDAGADVYRWRDPLNIASWYTERNAVELQMSRMESER